MGVKDDLQMEREQTVKNFRVVLRLCPPEQTDTAEPQATVRVSGLNTVTLQTGRGHHAHVLEFDAVCDEEASLRDVYESTAQPLLEYLMKGYNGCVIAYRPPNSRDPCGRLRGIISWAADDIFSSPEYSHCTVVRASFYHISNEKIYDLLEPQVSEVCRIHDTEEAVLLEGLREVEVSSSQELLHVYYSGTAHRNTGVSKGDFASKSHMVFNIMITNTKDQSDNEGPLTFGKLTLVDLASSAKAAYRSSVSQDVRRSFHVIPENPQEAKTLKRSLTIFRNVIFSLSSAGCQHVPYRESKLTRSLRDCLGGNCYTCLLVNVATQSSSVTETTSCLQFAAQAMRIHSRPIHTSQTHHTPAQVQNMWPAERSPLPLTRTQTLPLVSADRRFQACLPPILATSGSLAKPKLKHRSSLEGSESHPFLPKLEKPSPTEMNGHHGHGSLTIGQKSRAVDVCVLKGTVPLSHCLPTSVLSSSSLGTSLAHSAAPECPNCRQERKIREEYDKFIVQVKKDRDSLSQRVTELEEELKTRGGEERENVREERECVREERESVKEERESGRGGRKSRREDGKSIKEEKRRVRDKQSTGQGGESVRKEKENIGEGRESRTGKREGRESIKERREKSDIVVMGRGIMKEGRKTAIEESNSKGNSDSECERKGIDREGKEREGGEEEKAEDWNRGGRPKGDDSGRKESYTPHKEKSAEEVEALKAYLRVCIQQEKALAYTLQCERDHFTQNALELQEELERERNMSAQRITSLHSQTEHLLSELNRVREECEGLRERAALSITQLQKEKAELISHIHNTNTCYEKVCSENAELKARLEALLKDNSRACLGCRCSMDTHTRTDRHTSHTQTDTHSSSSNTHTVTTNAEMMLMSHCVSQQCSTNLPQGYKSCFSLCSGFPESSSDGGFVDRSTEPTLHTCHCDPALHKPQLYKQLRREHSLLLDMMLVLYKREWFLQDAMPYVCRTLRKCGLSLEHIH
ncbi:uncharacterized protein si:ch211-63b16.4 [Astyanax mexicanus]|uniref:uncharacterized protein si:ch211-63b16.4 n=1 Tax=Astyanax mexicanus TaxID=7994 RepID=UPI0020CB66EB|nr:uncharacterized protein si:ch211-63b16.4 [Astyanax mexicanus]